MPSFVTRVMKGGKSIYVEKAIVGQPKYATPMFSANMRSIEFNPDWTVPDTIKFEDLAPRLRQGSADGTRDISILTSNKLSVSYQGKPVDAATVDWDRANIRQVHVYPGARTRQRARRTQVQFSKPSRHLHARHDSAGAVQAKPSARLSHGCIRVRQPDRLAALLLAEDKGWSPQQVKDLLGQRQEQRRDAEQAGAGAPHLFHRGGRRLRASCKPSPTSMTSTRRWLTRCSASPMRSPITAGTMPGKRSAWNGQGFGAHSRPVRQLS